MQSGPDGRAAAGRMADEIHEGVESAARAAEQGVEKLARGLESAKAPVMEGRGTEMSRFALLETLAEIAQDLLQPLTVINCAVSMSLDGYVGPVAPEMENLLRMAQHGSQRLQKIMDALIRIVGYPTKLTAPGPANRI
jgi:signal transduction histidine kinase